MNSTPVPDAEQARPPLDPADPVLRQLSEAIELAREAAEEDALPGEVGEHVGVELEDGAAVTHLFDSRTPGYRGWCWAVTVSNAGLDTEVTVSEVAMLPGPDALIAPEWVPWQQRVQAGDLGVGDLMPTAPDDPRLVPGYIESGDPAVDDTAFEIGLGRPRVMSRSARLDAAARWRGGEFGPRSDMARGAPGPCATCGFYLPIAGALSAAFGVCGNEIAPADGHLVHAEYGCGAHSEAEVEQVSPVLVADLIYDDDAMLDIELVDRIPPTEPPVAPEESPLNTSSASPIAPEPEDAPETSLPTKSAEALETSSVDAALPTESVAGSEESLVVAESEVFEASSVDPIAPDAVLPTELVSGSEESSVVAEPEVFEVSSVDPVASDEPEAAPLAESVAAPEGLRVVAEPEVFEASPGEPIAPDAALPTELVAGPEESSVVAEPDALETSPAEPIASEPADEPEPALPTEAPESRALDTPPVAPTAQPEDESPTAPKPEALATQPVEPAAPEASFDAEPQAPHTPVVDPVPAPEHAEPLATQAAEPAKRLETSSVEPVAAPEQPLPEPEARAAQPAESLVESFNDPASLSTTVQPQALDTPPVEPVAAPEQAETLATQAAEPAKRLETPSAEPLVESSNDPANLSTQPPKESAPEPASPVLPWVRPVPERDAE